MKKLTHCVTALVILALLVALPAAARVYTVHLKNGNSFDTRYQPKVAEWDENKVVMLTDVGNRITLRKDDIVDITANMEAKGYGTVIDTTTIVLGWAPNDAPTETSADPQAQFQQYLDSLQGSRRENSVQQFVNTEDAGGGGLSTWEFGAGNFTGGPTGQQAPPPVIVAPPAPQQLPSGAGEGGGGGGDGS